MISIHSHTGIFVAIAIGGALGAMLRHATAELVGAQGILACNLLGSLALGLLLPPLARHTLPAAMVVTGLLGAFTTFSTFSYETVGKLHSGAFGEAALYVAASVCGSVALTLGGLWIGRQL